ncbi:MAG TPA: 1,4-dihydroxy-2-naphthoate octaprenyltransferase, partial [Thermomicrobiales bacterium]|nr:1,4-dihydroxy-2-naphthoate octaprenyltransferase [Thermomicrobiales bacterium]
MATMTPAPIPMSAWRVWFLAVRPWSLTISVVPILMASALAWQDGKMSIPFGLLMLLTSVLTHVGCNLTNDYFDNESGVDIVQNEGQGRMLQDGHLTDRDIRRGMIVSFVLALMFGAPIIVRLGWIGVAFALIGAGVAFFYTGGPWPLAYNRLGEFGVFVAMGIVMVGGAYYVHTGTLTWPVALLATNTGLYAAGILHSNNMRDLDVDLDHHKHTLANTFGWTWGVREY